MQIVSKSTDDTLRLGSKIARHLQKGDIICLFGELGSGKTVLTKGIARGLGINQAAIISPSFVLIRQHTGGKFGLCHFDLYRLKTVKDILALGYEDYLYGEAVSVIEWAERLKYLLPKEYLGVELFIKGDTQRLFKFNAIGTRYAELLGKLSGEPLK